MPSRDRIRINSLKELLPYVDADQVWVKWTVYCECDPESMTSYRYVQFGIDEAEIDPECAVHQQLVDALVKALDIPETSKRERISGCGGIDRTGRTLTYDVEWTRAVPYDWGQNFLVDGVLMELP